MRLIKLQNIWLLHINEKLVAECKRFDKMTKILFIAYQFPPIGGPGVQRSVQLVRHLREFGYEPIVLTIRKSDIIKGNYSTDESLCDLTSTDTIIYRTPSVEPIGFIQFMNKLRIYRLFWFIFYPLFWERSAMWPFFTYRKAKEIIKEHKIKLIYTTSAPFSSLLLGWLLKRNLKVKWVADLRDPFTDSYSWIFPTKLHWKLMRYFEKKILDVPDRLIVNTEAVKSLYRSRKIRDGKDIKVIMNGY
jgi:glycosyltransferase involved in cell wall biosynthesis